MVMGLVYNSAAHCLPFFTYISVVIPGNDQHLNMPYILSLLYLYFLINQNRL